MKLYRIPAQVRANALKALQLRRTYRRGGTIVGIGMARRLARGGSLPFALVKKVSEYFPRHQFDNLSEIDPPSNGRIAWLLWGGSAGWLWSRKIVKAHNKDN